MYTVYTTGDWQVSTLYTHTNNILYYNVMSKHKALSGKATNGSSFLLLSRLYHTRYMLKTAFSDGNIIIYADEQTNSGVFTTVEYVHVYIRHICRCIIL